MQLIKLPFNMRKIIPVNMNYLSQQLNDDFNKIEKYYNALGVNCDFSLRKIKYKREISNYLELENKDKVKHLLIERK